MRVAVRRSRAALRLFEHDLDQKSAREVSQLLRQLGRRLGVVRDLEVLQASFARALGRLSRDERRALQPVERAIAGDAREARAGLDRYLVGPRHASFMRRYPSLVEGLQRIPGVRAPGLVQTTRRRLAERVEAARAAAMAVDLQQPRPQDLHNLRIRLKELRYAIEFLSPLFGRASGPVLARLRRAQDELGALQDLEVEEASLRRLVRSHSIPSRSRAALDSLARARRRKIDRRIARSPAMVGNLQQNVLADESAVLLPLLRA